nr:MAG TPA: hypothetical protein [Caudoviricetes sp.]
MTGWVVLWLCCSLLLAWCWGRIGLAGARALSVVCRGMICSVVLTKSEFVR